MKKLFAIITVLMLVLSLAPTVFADDYNEDEVILVALLSDGVALSDPIAITEGGEYTFTIKGLNVDTAKDGLPTVYIKDGIRHATDQISGYFTGAKATTVSFKINGKEVEVPQNKVGDTASFGNGYIDMCWIWNGCPLDLGGEVITEISVTVNVEMPGKKSDTHLIALTEGEAEISEVVEVTADGEYTYSLTGMNINVANGFIPTVFVKDAYKHSFDMDTGFFDKTEVKTLSFKINGIEVTVPQNPVDSVAQMNGSLNICWIWNGCPLNLSEYGIETITDITVALDINVPGETLATEDDEPLATEPVSEATEPATTTTEATTTEATTTTTEATTTEATTTEATTTTTEATTEATTTASEEPVESEPEATGSVASEDESDKQNEEAPADNEADEQSKFPWTPVLIGVAVVAVIALVVVIAIPTKKQ